MLCNSIASLWKSGAIKDLPCPSIIPPMSSFHHPFLPSVILSILIRKIFITLFSKTVRVTKLKLGTHIPSGLICCVYWNQRHNSWN